MEIKIFNNNPMNENTYIITENEKWFIIDPGFEDEKINIFTKKNKTPQFILITHGHYDHIGGINFFIKKYENINILSSKDCEEKFYDPEKNLSYFFNMQTDFKDLNIKFIKENDIINFENNKIEVFETPGHSKDSLTFKLENNFFVGDLIFKQGIGRYDMPDSNINELKKSIKRIMQFDDKSIIYSGHGEKTTLENEKENLNFYLENI